MRFVIFAGGAGRRLWPISRTRSPKQFEPIVGDKSTLQLAMERLVPRYDTASVFVATNEQYVDIVCAQLPMLPPANLIVEPARRDLGPAVGLAMAHLARSQVNDPVAILWSDNFIENVPMFQASLAAAETLIDRHECDIVFMGETPRFANENLGWIQIGESLGQLSAVPYFAFHGLTYRPDPETTRRMFASGHYVWNTGFFVTTPAYIRSLYERFSPRMWQQLCEIEASIGQESFAATLAAVYPGLEAVSFDDAILTHLDHERAVVLHTEMGWSDPGTLYALKETLNPDRSANVTKGLVVDTASRDSLIYNYETDKLVMAVGLEGMIVVNTEDAILVVHKDHIPMLKDVVNTLQDTGLESYS